MLACLKYVEGLYILAVEMQEVEACQESCIEMPYLV